MKKSIIFDCNGVFLSFKKSFAKRFQFDFNVPADVFFPIYLEIMNNVRRPSAPKVYDLFKPYFNDWGIQLTEQELMNYWFDAESVDSDMLELLKTLHKLGTRSFILSNNFRERHEHKLEFFNHIEKFCEASYYSWKTGFVKPNHDAFLNLLIRHELSPADCLFIDDSSINIAAGAELGLESYFFHNADQIREILRSNLLI